MNISESQPAIRFDDVWKSFRRHSGRLLLRDRVMHLLHRSPAAQFHALQGISFRVQPGESVGVIGHNGAGKSTLLNLATGVCRPDAGRVEVTGRIAALLDLGAGFHPDLTGAENICTNASLLGLSRQEVRERFDEMVAFADIGDFIHEPLRTYSSGMIMRVAFSVAVSVDPDILIIDEILGVGDLAFQAKCQDRILQFRHAGKTILCVSHSTGTLPGLCERAIWLSHGRVIEDGPVKRVVESYNTAMSGQTVYSTG